MRHYPLSGSPFRAGHDFISTPLREQTLAYVYFEDV
jgi:hypothetical protein